MTLPAIVLSAHTMGLAVIRCLGIMGVPIVAVYFDDRDMGYASKYVIEKVRVPHPDHDEKGFINALLDRADRWRNSIMIPACDETVSVVSRNKDLLKQYYLIAAPNLDISERFIDKLQTYRLAEKVGVPSPKTYSSQTEAELENVRDQLRYPILVKPRESHLYYEIFRTKMVQANNFDELVHHIRLAQAANLRVCIQEIIPGRDSDVVNYNSYFWQNKPMVEFTAQQIRKAPPEYGAPRVVMSKDIPEIIEPGRQILQAIQYSGYSCVEFKKDSRDGVYKLMEVNGRYNRSGLLALKCGINFPWLEYQHLVNNIRPHQQPYRKNVYWISLDRDIGYGFRYRRNERYSLKEQLKPYLKTHIFDYLSISDPKPFFQRLTNLFRDKFAIRDRTALNHNRGDSNERTCH